MASFINKRQQARNERALQELLHNVPGNDRCADCQARNPGWASWSLGIFLCIRCASLHRKLGTHISKVKSMSMDTWNSDQVDAMRATGNVASNRLYNPRNVKPDLPLDPDEIDIAMEKFIRAKYQRRTLGKEDAKPANRNDTGSSASTDDPPPPVPAKNTPRFASALRAASSTYPVGRTERPLPPINEPDGNAMMTSDGKRPLGSVAEKLQALGNMGFTDERKNLTLLKKLNGDVEKTTEALVRLGEGDDATRTAVATGAGVAHPVRTDSLPTRSNGTSRTPGAASAHESTQANLGTAGNGVNHQSDIFPSEKSWNPFAVSIQQYGTQPTPPLDTSFQSMTILQQPLFPNNTGTWQQNQSNPFLKTLTPPISPSPYQYTNAPFSSGVHQNYAPQRVFTDPTTSTNPFLRSSRSQTFAPSGLSNQVDGFTSQTPSPFVAQSAPPVPSPSPWALTQRSESQPQVAKERQSSPFAPRDMNPYATQLREQFQSAPQYYPSQGAYPQQNIFSESPIPSPGLQNPPLNGGQHSSAEYPFQLQLPSYQQFSNGDWQPSLQPTQHPQQPQPQQQPQQHPQYHQSSTPQFSNGVLPMQPSQTQVQASAQGTVSRLDKSSILALYGQSFHRPDSTQAESAIEDTQASAKYVVGPNPSQSPAVDVSSHNNPFANLSVHNGLNGGVTHGRDESKDFIALMSRSSGRHSPDAFSGLSARYR